ncbi:uncharacterized protein LOC119117177 isoform X2 [Syngnathus acus]|uniref:uncharacterized protein LOC119117177 isoform X2 n=1 Tax=Syngnathus acus TaxID=161584 RepID=UPI0018862EEB|nr:uncharacterized protein LOC119117177 isoform X2 [Syngnathus acus]
MSLSAAGNADLRRPRRLLLRRPVVSRPPEALGGPVVFVSFVSKAVLWERPVVSCRTARVSPQRPSSLCPRFLSHMKSDCQGLRPPCFLSSKPPAQPPSAGIRPAARPYRPPPGSGHGQTHGRAREGVRYAVASRPPVPPSSTIARPHSKVPKDGRRPADGPEAGEPDGEFCFSPSGAKRSEVSSDLGRPTSGLFSRSTGLAGGRSSVTSGDPRQPSSASPGLPERSHRRPTPRNALVPINAVPPELPNVDGSSEKPEDTLEGVRNSSTDAVPPLDSRRGVSALSPILASRRTPSADPRRWPVLPPISPLKGRCGSTTESPDSELSGVHCDPFEEADAVAPSTPSSRSSLDRAADSRGSEDWDRRASSVCAALTAGRRLSSGDSGSLARVRLLLLERRITPEGTPDLAPGEQDDVCDVTATSEGPTGSPDSFWKVPEADESDWSLGASRSPSSCLLSATPSSDGFPSGSSSPEEVAVEEAKHSSVDARKSKVLNMLYKMAEPSKRIPADARVCSDFDDFDFLAKFCIFSPEKLEEYKRAFEAEDSDGDGYISCVQVVDALKRIVPAELLSEEEEIYLYRILALVDFRVTDGLVDVRLFAVIASLAQKIAAMDDFMRSLVTSMDFRSLQVRLFKVKQLFLFLLDEHGAEAGGRRALISGEQLALELKAGGMGPARELRTLAPLDLLDFLAYLPLFMRIHTSVVDNPLRDATQLASGRPNANGIQNCLECAGRCPQRCQR